MCTPVVTWVTELVVEGVKIPIHYTLSLNRVGNMYLVAGGEFRAKGKVWKLEDESE